MVLIFHDRGNAVNDTQLHQFVLPNSNGFDHDRSSSVGGSHRADIGLLDSTPAIVRDGPGGVLTETNMDGGNSSNHGYVKEATLPNGVVNILSNGNDNEIVTFAYAHGEGHVIYSSIPLDYYIDNRGPTGTRAGMDIYSANIVAYAVSLVDPIVLDLDGDGFEFFHVTDSSVDFSMTPDGLTRPNDWLAPDDGFLVFDKNDNGQIDDITELFSEYFAEGVTSGLGALKTLDENSDGVLDSQDSQFSQLRVWQDLNSDGRTDESELKLLSDFGISNFDLSVDPNVQLVGESVFLSTGIMEHINGDKSHFGEVAIGVSSLAADIQPQEEDVDLGSISKLRIEGVERIDSTNGQHEKMTLDVSDIFENATGPNVITLTGDVGDSLVLDITADSVEQSKDLIDGSVDATRYIMAGSSTNLLVDNDISVSINHFLPI